LIGAGRFPRSLGSGFLSGINDDFQLYDPVAGLFGVEMQEIWLNIGCGRKHLNGFVNMDIVRPYDKKLDARAGLPYPDQSVKGVYSEHFFEHLTQAEGLRFMRECRRVLKSGGRVRVAMPDLDEIVQRYQTEDWRGEGDMFKLGFDWVVNRCEMMNIAMREWGHKHVYNEEELIRIARCAGLEPVARYRNGESDTPQFVGRETRNSSKLIMEFTIPERAVGESPLVSVLIPAYRATFFEQALQSAQAQTYTNLEIVVCDDSADQEIAALVQAAAVTDARLRYVRNEPPQGGLGNYLKCFSLANGEFIKFLNDDDVLASDCVEKMLCAFRANPAVTLVTSRRRRIDEAGRELGDIPATAALSGQDCELEGSSCADALIATQTNFIGEPSTVMFRKLDLAWVQPHFMAFGGMVAVGAGDAAMWLNLLGRGNAYYISKPLSDFRMHVAQRQNEPLIRQRGMHTWRMFLFHGRRLGFLRSTLVLAIKRRSGPNSRWHPLQIITTRLFFAQVRAYLRIAAERYLALR
jgi:predicted SAM-dependent methyltransferase/glycosyltransferase involved in cell wall biosynthesis